MAYVKDCLDDMISEHQRGAADLNPFDADAREDWFRTGAQLLAAVPNHTDRLMHMTNLAIVFAIRCPDTWAGEAFNRLRERM